MLPHKSGRRGGVGIESKLKGTGRNSSSGIRHKKSNSNPKEVGHSLNKRYAKDQTQFYRNPYVAGGIKVKSRQIDNFEKEIRQFENDLRE